MEVKAKLNNLRMSPRKVRLVAGLVRGKKVAPALDQLTFSPKWSSLPLAKLLKSAIANATNNFGLQTDNLFIKTLTVDGGATLKRWMPRAQGRATPLNKRTSHITIVLGELVPSATPAEVKKPAIEPAVKLDAKPKSDEGVKVEAKEEIKPETDAQGKVIVDPHHEAQGKHTKIEGGKRGFTTKVFRRKSG
jgi:large subunit ribosomal protein L22